jgi:hypothetical protein
MLAFVIKAVVAALKKFPEFNASLDGDNLVYKQYFNIGFAADTPNGLVVPVIKDADKKGILQISQEMGELAKKARDGKLGAADMQGGCFSISSLGGIGGTYFTPIINAPEVAILGLSKGQMKPVWDGKQFVPRLMLPLSLSYDHRVIDGAAAARFNAYLPSAGGLPPHPAVNGARHMAIIDIKVPDIGDFAEVGVIEVLVKPGDTVAKDQSLITVESDKASMEILQPCRRGQGTQGQGGRQGRRRRRDADAGGRWRSGRRTPGGSTGPAGGGSSACRRSARIGSCLPQPATSAARPIRLRRGRAGRRPWRLLGRLPRGRPGPERGHRRALRDPGRRLPERGLHPVRAAARGGRGTAGVSSARPEVNIDQLRGHKDKVIGKLTGGLGQMAKMRKVTVVRGYGNFVGANHLEVEETTGDGQEKTGSKKVVQFKRAIIAAGSQPCTALHAQGPARVDSTGALDLAGSPSAC